MLQLPYQTELLSLESIKF